MPAKNAKTTTVLKPNAKVGRWRLGGRLGRGGQGEVWQVRPVSRSTHSPPRALKVCTAVDDLARERFAREVRLMQGFNHPHLMPIAETGTVSVNEGELGGELPYYVMALGHGTLADVSPASGLVTILRLFREAAAGISFLHAQSPPVLHRDIKPSNVVVLCEENTAVVADLGIAVEDGAHGELTATVEVVGSLRYRAPEVARGELASVRSDIYGLGRVLQYLLLGREPESAQALIRPAEELQLSARAASALGDVLKRAVALDPADRFASVTELLDALPNFHVDLDTTSVSALGPRRAPIEVLSKPRKIAPPFLPGGPLGHTSATYVGEEIPLFWAGGDGAAFAYIAVEGPEQNLKLNQLTLQTLANASSPFLHVGGPWTQSHVTIRHPHWSGVCDFTQPDRAGDPVHAHTATLIRSDGWVVALQSEIVASGGDTKRLLSGALHGGLTEGLRQLIKFHRWSAHARSMPSDTRVRVYLGLQGLRDTVLALPGNTSRSTSERAFDDELHAEFDVDADDFDAAALLAPFLDEVWALYNLDRSKFASSR